MNATQKPGGRKARANATARVAVAKAKGTRKDSRELEARLAAIVASSEDAIIGQNLEGIVTSWNASAEKLFGYRASEIIGQPITRIIPPELQPEALAILARLRRGERIEHLETIRLDKSGGRIDVVLTISPIRDKSGRIIGASKIARAITERKRLEAERGVIVELFKRINDGRDLQSLMRAVTLLLREWSGCAAVGIRLKQGEDFPYFETRGFPPEFVRTENTLCAVDSRGGLIRDDQGNPLLECMCGNVLCGRFDPTKPFFTAAGSFWTNSTSELLVRTTEADRQARTRNRCNGEGYESVALVPLRFGAEVLGLLQFNDRQKGRFTPGKIALLENLAASLGVALAQRRTEQGLAESEQRFRIAFKTGSDAYVIVRGDNGRIVEVNDQFEIMYGYQREELIGRTALELGLYADPARREQLFAEVASNGQVRNREFVARRKGGETFLVLYSASLLSSLDPKLMLGVIRDVTEQRKTEQALRTSEAKYRRLYESITDACASVDMQGRIQDCNSAFSALVGYSPAELQTMSYLDLTPSKWHTAEARIVEKQILKRGYSDVYEKEYRRKDGTLLSVELRCFLLRDDDGQPTGVGAIVRDITKRKEQEGEILRLSRLYLALSQASQLMTRAKTRDELLAGVCEILVRHGGLKTAWIGRHDPQSAAVVPVTAYGDEGGYLNEISIFADNSPQGSGPTGLAIQKGCSQICNDFAHAKETEPWHEAGIRKGFGSSAAFPMRERGLVCGALMVYAGEPGFFQDKEVLLFEEAAAEVSFGLDALEQEAQGARAAEALRQSEQRYKAILQTAMDGFCCVDLEGRFLEVSDSLCRMSGYQREELLTKRVSDLEALETPAETAARMQDILAQKHQRFETKHRRKDGTVFDVEVSVQYQTETPGQIFSFYRDITEGKRAKEALRDSEQRLNLALHSAKMGIWDWDLRSNRLTWDNQMFRLYGISEKPARQGAETWEQYLHPQDRAAAWEACQAALRGEKDYDTEFRVWHPDGTIRHIKANGLVLRDEQRKPVRMLGVNYDVTERRQLEEQLLQAQKMEAVGQLAGGVAHDFNNILAATLMHLGLLQQNSSLDQATRETLAELERDSRRAADLTRQLLLFSRRSTPELKPLNLNEVVTNLLNMLKRLIGENIAFKINPGFDLPLVMADPGMIEQVIMNLCVNARDAMPKGGEVEIGLEVVLADEARTRGHPDAQPGQFVCLSVADTGCGMDQATRQRIFEPFFTTKGLGRGTGLGLATVHGIVGLHKGWVEVESELGRGSIFRVFLPASAVRASEPVPAEESKLLPGDETILLVEDEASLRRATSQGLRLLGYGVLEAADGQEALKVWSERHQEIDLLLSDIVMPGGITGIELAERLRKFRPGLKVIISSGYSAEMLSPAVAAEKNIIRMQKPYKIDALSQALRRCLDGK
jgi:PAS domain S-box-containing protein